MSCTPTSDGVCVPCLLVESGWGGIEGEDSGGEEEGHWCVEREAGCGLYSAWGIGTPTGNKQRSREHVTDASGWAATRLEALGCVAVRGG